MVKFFTFEGLDCSGKSLQSKLLASYFINSNVPVFLLKYPLDTNIYSIIHNVALSQYCNPLTELFLFSASLSQLTQSFIKPSLDNGFVVICERYFHSTLAYQGYGRNIPLQDVIHICNLSSLELHPTKTFLLQPPYEVLYQRIVNKINHAPIYNRIQREHKDFHKLVYDGFSEISNLYPYFQTISTDSDPLQIHHEIVSTIKNI